MAFAPTHQSPGGATVSTVLKWCGNGELSALDLQRVVHRLQQADPVAQQALHPSHFSTLQAAQLG